MSDAHLMPTPTKVRGAHWRVYGGYVEVSNGHCSSNQGFRQLWSAPVREIGNGESHFKSLLQHSTETRMRAIQQRISICHTYCNTADLYIRCDDFDRAQGLLDKLHSAVDALTVHIDNPKHVSNHAAKSEFQQRLVQLNQRLWHLDSKIVLRPPKTNSCGDSQRPNGRSRQTRVLQ